MNYQVMGQRKSCDYRVGVDKCGRDATVLFVMRTSVFSEAFFRLYCAEHAEEQRRSEEGP